MSGSFYPQCLKVLSACPSGWMTCNWKLCSVSSLGAGDETSFIRDASCCGYELANEFTGVGVCEENE